MWKGTIPHSFVPSSHICHSTEIHSSHLRLVIIMQQWNNKLFFCTKSKYLQSMSQQIWRLDGWTIECASSQHCVGNQSSPCESAHFSGVRSQLFLGCYRHLWCHVKVLSLRIALASHSTQTRRCVKICEWVFMYVSASSSFATDHNNACFYKTMLRISNG